VARSVVRPANRHPGHSTAVGGVVDYRLDKIDRLGLIRGHWLDCGCAEGDYTVALVRRGASSAVGTDIAPARIEAARERWADVPAVSFAVAAAGEMPFADASFDAILLNEVLEHVEDERRTLRELHRLLVPGGHLVVFSPNRWFPFEGHGLLGPVRMGFPVPLVPWLPQRLFARWLQARNYWPYELRRLVKQAGFEIDVADFALPLLEQYEWLPPPLLRLYKRNFELLDRHRLIRRFGVSTFLVCRRAIHSPSGPS
jgi:ubiquinone/menaquinone biosynthesis C-methylase UbiE